MVRKSFQVYGRVQGVAYRANTHRKAVQIGVSGFVKNQSDGSVYLEAQGTAEQLEILQNWLHEGPLLARVDRVDSNDLPVVSTEDSFRVQW
jgi:acylphosphatase